MAKRPTADDIRTLRDADVGCGGLQQCRAKLLKEWRLARLKELRWRAGELYTVEACHAVILELIEFLGEAENDSE